MLVRFFLAVFAFLVSTSSAFADGSVPTRTEKVWRWQAQGFGVTGYKFSSPSAACDDFAALISDRYNGSYPGSLSGDPSQQSMQCTAGGLNASLESFQQLMCNGTPTTAETCPCPSGSKPNPAGDACIPDNACASKAGTSEQRNFTLGWSRTSGSEQESAWDASVLQRGVDLIGTTVCDGTCLGTVSANNQSNAWQSTQPNGQGLYRLSVDYTVTYTGATCTASQKSASLDPAAPSPSCDGYLGQINNKPACVGKPGTSDPKVTAPSPVLAGNPAAGSTGTEPGRTGGGGGSAGGPSSPSDGQIRGGSGSPTNGSGGTGSSATGDKEIKVEMCGSKGQPACKIDESGTPDGKAAYDSAGAALERESGRRLDGIRDAGNNQKSLPWSPTGILLPPSICQKQTTETRLGPLSLDVCTSPIANLWRDLLSWLLYMLTLLYAWRAAGGSIGGGK